MSETTKGKYRKGKNPNSLKNLKLWQKGKSGNPKGRKRVLVDVLTEQLKSEGYKAVNSTDVINCYKFLLNLPISRVVEIIDVNNDEYPLLYKIVGKELIGKRGQEMIEKILDRAYGRTPQVVQQTTELNVRAIDVPKSFKELTEDEQRSLIELYEKMEQLELQKPEDMGSITASN